MGFVLFAGIELLLFAINSMVDFKDKKQFNIAAGLMFFIMFVFAALRGSGDADYYNYLWFARDIGTDLGKVFDGSYPVEFAFRLASFVVNVLGLSRQFVIILMNLASILPIAYISIKESYNPFLSAIVFLPIFIQFDMQTSRTASAIGLAFMAAYLFIKGRKFGGFIFFVLSFFFHKSALIVLPFLVLLNFRISNGFKVFTSIIALGLSLFSMSFFRIIQRLVSAMGLGIISRKIENYAFSGYFAQEMHIIDPRIIFMAMLFVFSIMYFGKDSFAKNSIEEVASKAIWYGLVVFLVFRASTAVAFRFGNFFTVYQLIFLPVLIRESRRIDKSGLFFIILSIIFFVIPYAIFLMNKAPAYDFFFTNPNAIHSLTV